MAWVVIDQQSVEYLNEAVNRQWENLASLERLARWRADEAMCKDLVQMRADMEDVSAALNEALVWEGPR